MPKKSSRNNNFLNTYKKKTSSKIYSLLVELVNEEKDNFAEDVVKIDYLLEYSSTCIKQNDFDEAKDALSKIKIRIDKLDSEEINTEHLKYLYEGLIKKLK